MLKVVGASWKQMQLSWWMLAGVAVLGLITVYCGGRPRATADGNYAATVSWNPGSGFRCEYFGQNNAPESIKKGVARAYYQSRMAESGFAVLEIETQKEYPDYVQAYAAGYLEGSLNWQLIYWHWQNTVQKTCTEREEFCETVRTALAKNTDYIRQRATRHHKTDPYWHEIKLFYDQLDGLMYGWMAGVRRSRSRYVEELTFIDFLWINIASDLRDLEKKFNSSRDFNPSKPSMALAIIKLLPNDVSKFVLGHFSAASYSGMLRVQKKYAFGYHRTGSPDSPLVPGQTLLFSSYPGSLHSQDDLYLIASDKGKKLFVIGTAIQNFNTSLWERTDLSTQIIVGPRILAANRLSVDGETWSSIAARENSGTGNKQWIYLKPEKDKVRVWVTEMMPGISKSSEVTQIMREKGFWISSNRPHFRELQSISGISELSADNSTAKAFDVSASPAAVFHANPAVDALLQGQVNVSDLTSLMTMLRNPDVSIVGRSDLLGVRDPILFYSLLPSIHYEEKRLQLNPNVTEGTTNLTHHIDASANVANLTGDSLTSYHTVNLTLQNLEPATATNLVKKIFGTKLNTNDEDTFESANTAHLVDIIVGSTNLNSDVIDGTKPTQSSANNETSMSDNPVVASDRQANNESGKRLDVSRKDPAQNELDSEWTSNVGKIQLTAEISGGESNGKTSNGENDKDNDKKESKNMGILRTTSQHRATYTELHDSSEISEETKNHARKKAQTDDTAENRAGKAQTNIIHPKSLPSKLQKQAEVESSKVSREIYEILEKDMLNDKNDSKKPSKDDNVSVKSTPTGRLLAKLVSSSEQILNERSSKEIGKSDSVPKPNKQTQPREPQLSGSSDTSESVSDDGLKVMQDKRDGDAISRSNHVDSSSPEDSDDGDETMQIDSDDDDSRSETEQTVDMSLQLSSNRLSLLIDGNVMDDAGSNVDYNGLIDTKVVSSEFDLRIAAGPPWAPVELVEPFSWSTSFIKNSPHIGQVDTWDYDFVQPRWAWPVNATETSF